MKKVIAMILLVAMALAICACSGEENVQVTTDNFSVGYARVDITPQTSVPMAGFGRTSQRMSQNIMDNLYATAIAMSDGEGTTVVFITLDLQRASNITVEAVREMLSTDTGIPQNQIIISGTHTHSGPDLNNTSEPSILQYIQYLDPRIVQCAKDALADMKPAQLYVGSAETEGLNFVKHYSYVDTDGTTKYFGDNFGSPVYNDTTKHTTQADTTMHLLKITREGQKDIIMANWRAHPTITGAKTNYDISADFPGAFRLAMEAQLDCQFAYFNGAAGNLNAKSRIAAEMAFSDVNDHGALLAKHAMEGLQNMTQVETGPIQLRQTVLDMEINHDTDSLYYQAKEISNVWSATGDYSRAVEMGKPYGIRSPYMASSIVGRKSMADSWDVELDAIVIGNSIAIVTAPNELFDTNSEYVEAHSPYQMTMTFGYTNGYRGYIPSAYGWEYTSYESDCCYFKAGCGEVIQNTFLSMLNDIHDA